MLDITHNFSFLLRRINRDPKCIPPDDEVVFLSPLEMLFILCNLLRKCLFHSILPISLVNNVGLWIPKIANDEMKNSYCRGQCAILNKRKEKAPAIDEHARKTYECEWGKRGYQNRLWLLLTRKEMRREHM